MRQLKSCGVLVVRGSPIDSFLLMLHPNRLDLPKGHLDPGESEVQCALRELEEETGIRPEDVSIDPDFRFETHYRVWPAKYGFQECHKTLVIFLARLLRDVSVRPTEHTSHRWFTWNPPHRIQQQTIDPVLAAVESHVASAGGEA